VSKALPDEAEAGGGLMVAVVQLAITAGAASGGALFDAWGYRTTFTFSALVFGACAAMALLAARGQAEAVHRTRSATGCASA
jgi:predicted MFS family arabinose efflux permease